VAATIVVGLIAVMPIFAAVIAGAGGKPAARSAFAAAPTGVYAIGITSEDDVDIVQAVTSDGAAIEVARVPHLAGFASKGTVSPDGRLLALVAADSGPVAHATASLITVDLDSGATKRLVSGLDTLQTPVWAADSSAVVVRTLSNTDSPITDVTFQRVALDGSKRELGAVRSVAGAYAIGFDPQGHFLAVVIDERGSTLLRDMGEAVSLGNGITRDWRLSPDGASLAYIAADVSEGLRYLPRVAKLDGDAKGSVSAQSLDDSQALGVAWNPADDSPLFGREQPAAASTLSGGVSAQNLAPTGFDVPLDYAPDGSALAVQHWSGSGFDNAGQMELQLVRDSGRITLTSLTRFFGWARH
jgi:hypothetical protein